MDGPEGSCTDPTQKQGADTLYRLGHRQTTGTEAEKAERRSPGHLRGMDCGKPGPVRHPCLGKQTAHAAEPRVPLLTASP